MTNKYKETMEIFKERFEQAKEEKNFEKALDLISNIAVFVDNAQRKGIEEAYEAQTLEREVKSYINNYIQMLRTEVNKHR